MIYHLRFKISYLLICLLGYLFIVQRTTANPLALSLDPSIVEINAIPPETAEKTLSIKNLSDTEIALQIQIKPFKAKSEGGQPEYLNPEDFPILKNIQILDNGVSVEDIVLAPLQEKKLTLEINIPKDIDISARPPANSSAGEVGPARQSNAQALAGGQDYYFSIIFVSKNNLSPTSTSSLNQLGIAGNVLLSVGERESPSATLENFFSNAFFTKGPVPFSIKIKNSGVHYIKPKGQIIVKNMFGQNIGRMEFPTMNILSDSNRVIPNTLWKESFLLGFYTATLNLAVSDNGPIFTKSIRFFAFPLESALIIIITVIIIVLIRRKVERRYNIRHN